MARPRETVISNILTRETFLGSGIFNRDEQVSPHDIILEGRLTRPPTGMENG